MRAHTHHPPAGSAERLLVLAQPNLAEYLDSKYGAGEPMVEAEAEAEAEAEPVDRPRPPVRARSAVPPLSRAPCFSQPGTPTSVGAERCPHSGACGTALEHCS